MNLPVEICLTTCLSASAYFKRQCCLAAHSPLSDLLVTFDFLLPDPRVQNKTSELYICQVVVTVESGPTSSSVLFFLFFFFPLIITSGGTVCRKAVRLGSMEYTAALIMTRTTAPLAFYYYFLLSFIVWFDPVCRILCLSQRCGNVYGYRPLALFWIAALFQPVWDCICVYLSYNSAWWKREFLPKNTKRLSFFYFNILVYFYFLKLSRTFIFCCWILIVLEKKILLLSLLGHQK